MMRRIRIKYKKFTPVFGFIAGCIIILITFSGCTSNQNVNDLQTQLTGTWVSTHELPIYGAEASTSISQIQFTGTTAILTVNNTFGPTTINCNFTITGNTLVLSPTFQNQGGFPGQPPQNGTHPWNDTARPSMNGTSPINGTPPPMNGSTPPNGMPPENPTPNNGTWNPGGGQQLPMSMSFTYSWNEEYTILYLNGTEFRKSTAQDSFSNITPPNNQSGSNSTSGGNTDSFTGLKGIYTFNRETTTQTNQKYESNTTDTSAIYAFNGSDLTLLNPTIRTTGDTTSNDRSSFYGLNAAVLATTGSKVTLQGGTITTSGTGANGAFSTGTGASVTLANTTITATGGGGHAVMATQGGTLTLYNVNMTTSGANGAPIATDRGEGTVLVIGGTVKSNGQYSPGIYSTGTITVTNVDITATGAEAAVIEGANTITVINTTLTGSTGTRNRGVMLYCSMSGDADPGTSTFTMNGGTLTWMGTGPTFYVTNTEAIINVQDVDITTSSTTLLNASNGDWGTSGSNGANVLFNAENETLTGNIVCDSISSITVTLQNTLLTGSINTAALTLDTQSIWNLTGESHLTSLIDSGGISGTSITNIIGNGYNVYYDMDLSANSVLNGLTYTLTNGGQLIPE